MISTKRQIRRDDDRYGGFGMGSDSLISEYGIIGNEEYIGNSMLRSDTDIDITNNVAPAVEPMYSPIGVAAPMPAQQKVEVPAPEIPERQPKEEVPHSREDVLPTLKTRSYGTIEPEKTAATTSAPAAAETSEVVKRERRGLSSREKLMLCIYVAIALVLAVAVIATGVSISAASVQSDALATQIEQKQAVILAQESELAILRDEDNIRGRATEFGMVRAGDPVYKAPIAETVEYPEPTPHTNGFDKFMDWLSHILN